MTPNPVSDRMRDLTDQRFGDWKVIKRAARPKKSYDTMWLCLCLRCGKEKEVGAHTLRRGESKSCCGRPPKGKDHPSWKGGKIVKGGYFQLNRPDHPNADKNGYVYEHVFVMSSLLGRALVTDEVVHHINGDRQNNSPENLELRLRRSHPPGQDIPSLVQYAEEILKRYAPEKLAVEEYVPKNGGIASKCR